MPVTGQGGGLAAGDEGEEGVAAFGQVERLGEGVVHRRGLLWVRSWLPVSGSAAGGPELGDAVERVGQGPVPLDGLLPGAFRAVVLEVPGARRR